jgi:hypothetical protein
MKTKLIFSTETQDTGQWIDLPFIPRLNEWINVVDILKKEELVQIWQSAHCWSGIRGTVQSVEYRCDDQGFYIEVYVWCED